MRVVAPDQAKRVVGDHLFGRSSPDVETVRCAVLRSCLWSLTRRRHPVHILRLMNLAFEIVVGEANPDDIEQRRSELRSALEALADVGDAVALRDGRWLPAPTSFVTLGGDANHGLLVGGVPSTELPLRVRELITHRGPYRGVDASVVVPLGIPTVGVTIWVGAVDDALDEWATAVLGVELSKYEEVNDGQTLKVYAPAHAQPRAIQERRWSSPSELQDGRFLALRERVYGAREYRVVEVRNKRVVKSGAVLLAGEARRIMYAVDRQVGNPVMATVERAPDAAIVTLWSMLPRSEFRLFGALGEQLVNPEERSYPWRWQFSERMYPHALARLRGLGIEVSGD